MSDNIILELFDHPHNQNALGFDHKRVWHPLDEIEGHVVIKSSKPLNIERIIISLEGISRVWTQVLDEYSRPRAVKTSYKVGVRAIRILRILELHSLLNARYQFLHQSHEIIDVHSQQDICAETLVHHEPFRLFISRWAILKTSDVPDQCLSLPPTLIVGNVLVGNEDGESYAQPNVSYRVRAVMEFKFVNSSETKMRDASRMINVVPYSEGWPPTDIHDFPAEFVGSASNSYRTSMFGDYYTMTLSMHEPPAVSFTDQPAEILVRAEIDIEIQPLVGKVQNTNINQLVESLKRLTFQIQPILRSKTFYSTTPFAKLPGQTMLTMTGPLRLHDEVMKLAAQSSKASSWNHRANSSMPPTDGRASNCSQISSDPSVQRHTSISEALPPTNQAKTWYSHITVPIVVPSQLPPTFCSAIASRQYSLIVRIKVSSVSIKDFVLELPLQIVYRPQQARASSGDLVELMESSYPDEELPGYS